MMLLFPLLTAISVCLSRSVVNRESHFKPEIRRSYREYENYGGIILLDTAVKIVIKTRIQPKMDKLWQTKPDTTLHDLQQFRTMLLFKSPKIFTKPLKV